MKRVNLNWKRIEKQLEQTNFDLTTFLEPIVQGKDVNILENDDVTGDVSDDCTQGVVGLSLFVSL